MTLVLTGSDGFVGKNIQKNIFCKSLSDDEGEVDIRDYKRVISSVSKNSPEKIIHLAAQSFIPISFKNPKETFEINFIGTLNILNALKEYNFTGKFLYIGSGDVYGVVSNTKLPLNENIELKPRNPYSVSKVAAEALCYQWSQTENFDVIMVRPFNHIGPGQSENFVVSDFAKQIIQIKLGHKNPILHVGDIDVTRDFTDVRDVVKAYQLLLEKGGNGEVYNVCSGYETSIRAIIDSLCQLAGITVEIKQDKSRIRISENKRIFGDNKKIRKITNWEPEISLIESLKDILNDWEKKLK